MEMYYNIVESGVRIRNIRILSGITRQRVADEIGISVDALRKIERGSNGAKIDTLVELADYFKVTLDYLVCGVNERTGIEGVLAGLNEKELLFVHNMVKSIVENMLLLK